MSARDSELKRELDAVVETRKELGVEYESALVESFLEKIDSRLDREVEQRVRRQLAEQATSEKRRQSRHQGPAWGSLPFVSLIFGIPLSAIGGEQGGLPGLLITWTGIVGINLAATFRRN